MIKISRSIVPNSFTVGNMLSGYMSIIFSVNQKDFTLAAWMIGLAAFLDAIDGKVARITNSSSKFGVEYDSLADVVSFGVAPSVLIYQYYFIHLNHIGLFFSFFPILFGSIRLARFNVELTGFTKTHFSGLPIPAAAITLASYILLSEKYFDGEPIPRLIMVITIIVSLLMISNVRYEVVPQISFKGSNKQKIIFIGIIVVFLLVLIFPNMLIFPLMVIYIVSGLIISAFNKTTEHRKKRRNKRRQSNDDETEVRDS